MKKTLLKTTIILAVMLSVIACSKEGVQGPKGDTGTNGTNGNANVMYSNWITYTSNFINSTTYKSMRIVVPLYTSGLVDSGGFYLCFIRWQDNVHYQLPFANKFNSTSSPVVEVNATGISFTNEGEIRVNCLRTDGGTIQNEFLNLITENKLQVRYFLIAGNVRLRLSNNLSLQEYYKTKSYEEICTLFDVKP